MKRGKMMTGRETCPECDGALTRYDDGGGTRCAYVCRGCRLLVSLARLVSAWEEAELGIGATDAEHSTSNIQRPTSNVQRPRKGRRGRGKKSPQISQIAQIEKPKRGRKPKAATDPVRERETCGYDGARCAHWLMCKLGKGEACEKWTGNINVAEKTCANCKRDPKTDCFQCFRRKPKKEGAE